MGGASRNKGKAGERELAGLLTTLTGHEVRRRVRQHDGDSDLEGLPGWCIEAKRYASATPAVMAAWWLQAVEQAKRTSLQPLLCYRLDRQDWRCVWPAHTHLQSPALQSYLYADTLQADVLVWARLAGFCR